MQTAYVSHIWQGKKHVEFQDGSRHAFSEKELSALLKDPEVKLVTTNEFLDAKMRPTSSKKNQAAELMCEALMARNEALAARLESLEGMIKKLLEKK